MAAACKWRHDQNTHEEQVVARLHAVLLGEGREVVGCASLELLLGLMTSWSV